MRKAGRSKDRGGRKVRTSPASIGPSSPAGRAAFAFKGPGARPQAREVVRPALESGSYGAIAGSVFARSLAQDLALAQRP
jgi:hypothetical protein